MDRITQQALDAARFRFLVKIPAARPKQKSISYEDRRKGYFWLDPFGVEHNAQSFHAAVNAAMKAWEEYL